MAKRRERERDTEAPARRARLTRQQGRTMLAGIVRRESAFTAVRGLLRDNGFADEHEIWDFIWTVVADHYEAHAELPTKNIVLTELNSLI